MVLREEIERWYFGGNRKKKVQKKSLFVYDFGWKWRQNGHILLESSQVNQMPLCFLYIFINMAGMAGKKMPLTLFLWKIWRCGWSKSSSLQYHLHVIQSIVEPKPSDMKAVEQFSDIIVLRDWILNNAERKTFRFDIRIPLKGNWG